MPSRFHIKEMDFPIYRGKFVIIFSNKLKKVKRCIPGFGHNEVYAHCLSGNWDGFMGYVIVLNFDSKNRPIFPGTIAHEAVHCAHMLAEDTGFVADFSNDEPITYLAEWITDEVYKFMREKKLKVTLP